MKMIFFWLSFGIFAVLFIIQMITAIPLLKKGTSPEEKSSRQPRIQILNSLMLFSAGIMLMVGFKQIVPFLIGVSFFTQGLLNFIRIKSKREK